MIAGVMLRIAFYYFKYLLLHSVEKLLFRMIVCAVVVNATDLAVMHVQMLQNLFELMINSSLLLTNPAINPADIWNVSYSAGSFGYWVAKSFIGNGGTIDWTRQNATAMAYFSNAINYLGMNATRIFGDTEGSRGMSAVLKNMTMQLNESFAVSFMRSLNENVKLAYKLLSTVNVTMG